MVNRLEKGFAPLCFIQEGKLICYKRGCLWVLAGNKVLDKYPIFNSAKEFLIGAINPFSRLLRLGIRASIALDENRVLLSRGNHIFELDLLSGERSGGYFIGEGLRPLAFTKIRNLCIYTSGSLSINGRWSIHLSGVSSIMCMLSWLILIGIVSGPLPGISMRLLQSGGSRIISKGWNG